MLPFSNEFVFHLFSNKNCFFFFQFEVTNVTSQTFVIHLHLRVHNMNLRNLFISRFHKNVATYLRITTVSILISSMFLQNIYEPIDQQSPSCDFLEQILRQDKLVKIYSIHIKFSDFSDSDEKFFLRIIRVFIQ